ncbi:NAD(P)-binding protein, partial [Acidobacteriota bacterium]
PKQVLIREYWPTSLNGKEERKMPKVVKKKKKKLGGGFSGGGGTAQARQTSPLRPKWVLKTPPCQDGCPNGTDIRTILTTMAQTEKKERTWDESCEMAYHMITERNPLPAVCGRVCPHPCEEACNRNEYDEPAAINSVERYLGDLAIEKGWDLTKDKPEPKDVKVAVVGSGPAGLSCAYQLARNGYKVTIFEAFSKAGGMLRYGIPPYRLPREILDKEIQRIIDVGVEMKVNTSVGNDIPFDDIKKEYKAVFVAIGAHKGLKLRVDGEDAENVYSGAEFLNMINSGEKIDVGNNVIVIGGGDSAIDAARVSKRLGAETTIVYRRTIKEMPAIEHEIVEAQNEGIAIEFLAAPVAIHRDNGRATGMKCIKMELGEPDASGRRRPVPIEGSEYDRDASTIIAAISQEPDFSGLENLKAGPKDWIKIDTSGKTNDAGVFAGGDVTDLGLVTIAIAQGRFAARAMEAYIEGRELEVPEDLAALIKADKMKLEHYEKKARAKMASLPVEERFADINKEIASGLTEEQVKEEVSRCMSCGYCMDCEKCWMYCQVNAIVKTGDKDKPYAFKLEMCDGCKKCEEECPCGYIQMF